MRPDEAAFDRPRARPWAPAHAVPRRSLAILALPVSNDNTSRLGREAEIPARTDAFHGGLHDLSRAKEGGLRHRRAGPSGGSGGSPARTEPGPAGADGRLRRSRPRER